MSTETAPEAVAKSFAERYGIRLTDIGEDGEVVVLGHHADKRRVVAALAAQHRHIYDERMARDLDPGDMVAAVEDQLTERWAVIGKPCGGHMDGRWPGSSPDCAQCRKAAEDDPSDEWFMFWDRKSTDAGAFPVTVFGAWS